MQEIEERLRARMHAQPMRAACALCPWTAEGLAGELLEAQAEHRRREHGITRGTRRRTTRHLMSPRQSGMDTLPAEDRSEIEREINRRAFLNGVDL